MGSPSLQDTQASLPAPAILSETPVVRIFTTADEKRWDRFVLDHPKGSFFMLCGWKTVLEKTFGYRAHYFIAERNGEITGIAPLFAVSNWVTGRTLISVPFGVYAGVCAADADSENALLDHLQSLARARRVEYLELRSRHSEPRTGFYAISRYVTFTSPLSADSEANLKRLPKDTRYMIRKAQKAGLRAQRGWDQLDSFFPLFAQNLQRHGTPAFPIELMRNIAAQFPQHSELLVIYASEKPVAGVVSFFFRDTVFPYYSGASLEAPRLAANNLLYWEVMEGAAKAGLREFDFGRSKKGTGSYEFKTQWNMNMEELQYQTYLVKRTTPPNFSPTNPGFERAIRLWKKLPLWLTMRIGPRVVRWFP
jgi:FemAB-related protein (PEP-CTERM system-associated)